MLKSSAVLLAALQLLSFGIQATQGARILNIMNVASPSHHVFNRVLSRALAARGHQVTVVSPDEDKPPLPANLTYVKLEGVYEKLHESFQYEEFADESVWSMINTMCDWVNAVCEAELKSEGAKKLMSYSSSEKFDLIITEAGWGECFYGFIPYFGSPPLIAISAFGMVPWTAGFMGTPEVPSYIPNFLLPYTSNMNFFQRVNNFVIHNVLHYIYEFKHIPRQEILAEKYFNRSISFWEIERNFSLFLANAVPGLDDARPVSPNVIPIGGMHIKEKPDPLPKDLQTFLDGAKEGAIFFSLGSNVRSDALPASKRQALLEAFSDLPQRVLWKFESENLPGQPPNVKIGKWLPQSDILAHPNIRLFISHCGKLSSTESVYRGVPIVGIPIFVDQILNMKRLKEKGVAVELDYHSLTKENILKAVREVLNNDSYRVNMKKMSAVFRDQPETPLERAIFWIEFVIRHGGAPHLRPASVNMQWHEYLLLDVILFLVTCVLVVLLLFYLILRTIYRKLFGKTKMKQKTH